jgi:hypothetical protein
MGLRIAQADETPEPRQSKGGVDVIPFHTLPCPWQPRAKFDPERREFDSVANAESALEHVERQMMNIRSLLGMNQGASDGRAA